MLEGKGFSNYETSAETTKLEFSKFTHTKHSKEFLLKTVCKVQDKLQNRKNNCNSYANSAKTNKRKKSK